MTSAQDDSDMNSQANRKVNASSASTTRFMPAPPSRRGPLEANPAATAGAGGAVGDEFDACRSERCHELHQRVDIAADDAFARLHALDGRQRQGGQFGELALIDAKERPRSAKLSRRDHV